MDRQRIRELVDLQGQRASNICLHYGRDKVGQPHLSKTGDSDAARMAQVEWNQGYPLIQAQLSQPGQIAVGGQQEAPPLHTRPFAICPSLPRSLISADVAQHFGLRVVPEIRQVIPIPLYALLFGAAGGIPANGSVQANMVVICHANVAPKPIPRYALLKFLVVPKVVRGRNVSPELALIGRDILDKMLLLYRGRATHDNLPSAPRIGQFYFGPNCPE